MQATSSTVAPTARGVERMFDGLGRSFTPIIVDWIQDYLDRQERPARPVIWFASPPLVVDVTDHLRTTYSVPTFFGEGIVAALVRRGVLRTTPHGHPAFHDLPTYNYVEVA